MLTVYCTRWWIRPKFTTLCIYNINSTYSHHNWCVYVLYPGVMTITRGGAGLGRGGGLLSLGWKYHKLQWTHFSKMHQSIIWSITPGTKLLRQPILVTQFWRTKSGFSARFCKTKEDYVYWSRGRGIVWNKSWWTWFKLLFGFILMNFFF